MNDKVLRAQGLCKSYGRKTVLQDLDLEVLPGKIYGLIGRNGAGKTTLLGILTGQNTASAGSVTYGGEPVWENAAALREMCFSRELQSTLGGSANNLSIAWYLRAGSIFFPNWDQAYADALLKEFDLEPRRKISRLSKGMMSMVTILLALASRAPLTILDEPVAGLDVVMRERFYQLLLEDYTRTGRTFLVSTHIMEELASLFERVIILDRGRILENCDVEDLVAQFHFISGREDVVDRVTRDVKVLAVHQTGLHKTVSVRCELEQLREAREADVDIGAMDLQQVFVALCSHPDGEEGGT